MTYTACMGLLLAIGECKNSQTSINKVDLRDYTLSEYPKNICLACVSPPKFRFLENFPESPKIRCSHLSSFSL